MSLNSLTNSPIPSRSLENFSSAPEISTSDTTSPLHNRTVAVDPKPITFGQRLLGSLFPCMRPIENRDSQHEITVKKPRFTAEPAHGAALNDAIQSPLKNEKIVNETIEYRLKENNEEEQSTLSGFSRKDSLNHDAISNDSKAAPALLADSDALPHGVAALFKEKKETAPSLLDNNSSELAHVLPALFKEKKEAAPALSEDNSGELAHALHTLFGEEAAIQEAFKGSGKIDAWFEKHSDNLSALEAKQTKELAQFEKKYPEALQNKLINHLVEAYSSKNSTVADAQLKEIRQQLSPQWMAAVDKSVIDTLQTNGQNTAATLYEKNQVETQTIHYNDVLKLDQLAQDLKAGRSLERAEQEKLLTKAKETLETIDTNSLTTEQQALMQAAKERVANLEHALPLVDNSKLSKGDILKTVGGSAALAACLTAIGALISALVKLGQSGAVEEQESVDEPVSDQTEAIEAKKKEIEDTEQKVKGLNSEANRLRDEGATGSEQRIKDEAYNKAKLEAFANDEFIVSRTGSDVINPRLDLPGIKRCEIAVEKAVEKHQKDVTDFNNLQNEITITEKKLNSQNEELADLNKEQKIHDEQKYIKKNTPAGTNNNVKTENIILGSIGLGVATAGAGAAGLFAVNSSKVLPKFKLRRANTQAVQSLNKLAQSNQPHVAEVDNIDPIKAESLVRRNSI